MNFASMLLPDEAMPLLLVVIGLGVMLGFRQLLGWIPSILLSFLLAPFISSLLGSLPPIVSILLIVGIVFWGIRGIFSLLLGQAAADHMVGALAAGVVRGAFMIVFALPMMLLRLLFRAAFNHGNQEGGPR